MTDSNSNIAHAQLRCERNFPANQRSAHPCGARDSAPHNHELLDVPGTDALLKIQAIEEAERRWPGIIVLAERRLDDELGVAVYFTFPGGKHMAVWMSAADELAIVLEDRPSWRAFVSAQDATPIKGAAMVVN